MRIALGMTITPHLWAVILGGNPEDIGLSCDHRGADQEEKGYNKSKCIFHKVILPRFGLAQQRLQEPSARSKFLQSGATEARGKLG